MKGIYVYIDKKDDIIVYVGKDSYIDTNERHKAHFSPSKYNDQPINRVLQNNPNRYTYQVLVWDVVDEDTLNALEVQYIRQLNTYHYDNPRGFNFTRGGDGTTGHKWTDEQKEKVSGENNHFYGKKHTKETKRKQSEVKKGENHPNWGKPLSEEHKQKIGKGNRGKTVSEESKRKISKSMRGRVPWNKGKPWSEEIKRKISKKLIGLKHTEERKKQQSERMQGENNPFYNQNHTEESKKKISEANKKYALWNVSCVVYKKRAMFYNGREPNPVKCFDSKYKGYVLPIGGFHDFITPQIINDLIDDAIGEY